MTVDVTTKLNPGAIIKILRKDRGYSLRELANEAGITASYLSKLENDINTDISLAVFSMLCRALNANPKIFLDEDLQSKLMHPMDLHDFFLMQELHYNGSPLTSEQKEVMLAAIINSLTDE
ncbi:helix-turn-helix domain-containing protein [Lysinibacillus sp. FJAT-14745]|uniref:helix-turn-helix domain-containing protein n=1 Tax=Lysinibacillus sp. FJAT-14745 TaxID=1704289 RepID=UPI0006ABBD79|nr:helix-turn-helix transcriptional regulator [Lysinibacillus sp. FJAT-14745]